MIVRINQIDAGRAEEEAGWAELGMLGPIRFNWPSVTRAYEVMILDQDEQKRPVEDSFRQQQLRQLIPEAAAALREEGEELVVRLDGPLTEGELLAALGRLTDSQGRGRYAVSAVRKLESYPQEEIGSVRLDPSPQMLATICSLPSLGLERSVRLRLFSVAAKMVNPLLDIDSTEDERWEEILHNCGFMLSTTRGLRSLLVRTGRFEPAELKSRLIRRLVHTPANVAGT